MALLKERESTTVITPSPITTEPAQPKFSRLRHVGQAIARHPRITQAAVLLMLTTGTGVFLLYSLFKGAWSPHQDNIGILTTIFKMEMRRENTQLIDDNPQQVITRSYKSLESHVSDDNWVWINRFGSTVTYGRQEQRIIASCSAYSPLYLICSLSEIL
ncbi:MAG: hypothetical protein AAGB19_18500 [Cyanobacteria bacterium P01_F01_bin.3]